jgi:hypothetical protein
MSFHRDHPFTEHPNTRTCRFCAERDPNFARRKTEDRLVRHNAADVASSHISEDGHVLHRIMEVTMLQQRKRDRQYASCA